MNEFAPEGFPVDPEDERIDALGEAFLAAQGDTQALDEEFDEEEGPIEPMDV